MNNKEYDACKEVTEYAREILERIDSKTQYFPFYYLFNAFLVAKHLQWAKKHSKDCLFYWENLKEVLLKIKPLKERFEKYYEPPLMDEIE
jgi:hypothetical protein